MKDTQKCETYFSEGFFEHKKHKIENKNFIFIGTKEEVEKLTPEEKKKIERCQNPSTKNVQLKGESENTIENGTGILKQCDRCFEIVKNVHEKFPELKIKGKIPTNKQNTKDTNNNNSKEKQT